MKHIKKFKNYSSEDVRPVREMFGAPWLTKITIDDHKDYSDEEKTEIAADMCEGYPNGCAVRFSDGTWVDHKGTPIEDIDAYEAEIHRAMDAEPTIDLKKHREIFGLPHLRNKSYDDLAMRVYRANRKKG
jgi:hypothetical protein